MDLRVNVFELPVHVKRRNPPEGLRGAPAARTEQGNQLLVGM